MNIPPITQEALLCGQTVRSQDAQLYKDLLELLKYTTRADEMLNIWQQIERIKNRHGGIPPKL